MDMELQNAHKAFLNFTLAKKRESFKDMSEGQRDAFNIIPYLLHTCEPKRFGFIDGIQAPCGIHGFKFSDNVRALGRKHFSQKDRFEDPKAVPGAPIESLSIMGSAGSIAQTEGSDLDYWVTIREGLKPDALKLLSKKFMLIEDWCWDELGAEVHFFASTAQSIRDNNFGSVDKESCGTALGKLLKEEYYRTSLHVMGKIPFWWLVPYNGNDATYRSTMEKVGPESGLEKKDFIDFGNIQSIPRDEFVGGGMWQLNKGVGSPFKSALKMGLLVEYADEKKPRDLLAQMLKRRMLENPNDMDQLDPYRMMVERVLEYHHELGDEKSESILQRCLFIKMQIRIARWWSAKSLPQHRIVRTMLELVKSWGWTVRDVEKWENFDILPMSELAAFKRDLEEYMFTSLQKLREGEDEAVTRAVSEEDFRKMTQRLATIFNPDPKRTEWFYAPYDKMIKSLVYSIQEEEVEGHWSWNLYTGTVDAEGQLSRATARKQLRSSGSLPELATWMLYNQLVRVDGKLFVSHRRDIPFTGNLKRLSEVYKEHIGKPELPTLDTNVFANDSYATKWLVVVNLVPIVEMETLGDQQDEEVDLSPRRPKVSLIAGELAEALQEAGYEDKASAMKVHRVAEEQPDEVVQLGGKRIPLRGGRLPVHEDPFNAGEDEGSIFHELFVIELNSWGEVSTRKIGGHQPVAEAMATMVRVSRHSPEEDLDLKVEIGFGPYHQKLIRERFIALMENGVKKLIRSKCSSAGALFQMDGRYVTILRTPDDVSQADHASFGDAIQHLNLEAEGSLELIFDELHPRLANHAELYVEAQRGENYTLITESGEGVLVAFVDQTGRYLFNAMTMKDFALQWPPFLLTILSSLQQWSQKEKRGRLRIVRRKQGRTEEITKGTLATFMKIKDKLPRTQLSLEARDAHRWMSSRKDVESVISELESALSVHGDKGAFIISSVLLKNLSKSHATWTPSVVLQLRQALIREGRRRQKG